MGNQSSTTSTTTIYKSTSTNPSTYFSKDSTSHSSKHVHSKSIVTTSFPSEFENTFIPRSQVLQSGQDRRILESPKGVYRECIGQLRMNFNGTIFVGTGTITHADYTRKIGYILTCAHNVIDIDDEDLSDITWATNIWFDVKNYNHTIKKRFKITNINVHPKYFENPSDRSGYDIAICEFSIKDYNNFDEELFGKDWLRFSNTVFAICNFGDEYYCLDYFGIYGFPGEKKGQLWGMEIGKELFEKYVTIKDKLFMYSCIDTTGGQSGSPIVLGAGDFGDMSVKCIAGVHTGGNAVKGKNWGTKITTEILKWVMSIQNNQYKEINDLFYVPQNSGHWT